MFAPSDRAPLSLALADGTALVVFVLVGMRSHHGGSYLEVFLRNAIPLLGAWALAASLIHTYRGRGFRRLIWTWIVAVPAGVASRSLWVGSPDTVGGFVTFLGVSLAFTLVFLMAGRGLVAAFARMRDRDTAQ